MAVNELRDEWGLAMDNRDDKRLGKLPLQAAEQGRHASASSGGMSRNQSVILAALLDAGKPMKAYELLEAVRDEGVRSPMTVYRALDDLRAYGLVTKISSMKAYVATSLSDKDTLPIFLICENCKETRVLRSHAMQEEAAELARKEGFSVRQLRIEITGLCCK